MGYLKTWALHFGLLLKFQYTGKSQEGALLPGCKILSLPAYTSESWPINTESAVHSQYFMDRKEGGFLPDSSLTFSNEIRQIQCTRTEFWCVQCPKPAGPSALDKHQIQASALDLSYFTSKSKCKFINLIHTQHKKQNNLLMFVKNYK